MTYRDTFAYGGKKFDHLFSKLNANRIGDPYYHDASDGSLPEEEAVNWFRDKIFRFLYTDNEGIEFNAAFDLIHENSVKRPDKIAFIDDDNVISYLELSNSKKFCS